MSTRGIYGIRKSGVDKITYNHHDSYPEYLGKHIIEFIISSSNKELNDIYDKIVLVDENIPPKYEDIDFALKANTFDFSVSRQTCGEWYCLLRKMQGGFDELKMLIDEYGKAYMIDDAAFIQDSLFCEYGYIINLDDKALEIYRGFQKTPDEFNRYGAEKNEGGYYPCKCVDEISLADIRFKGVEDTLELIKNLIAADDRIDYIQEHAKEANWIPAIKNDKAIFTNWSLSGEEINIEVNIDKPIAEQIEFFRRKFKPKNKGEQAQVEIMIDGLALAFTDKSNLPF